MSPTAAEHLAALGVTVEQARGYVMAHAGHDLEGILEVAHSHGITNSMLAEIVGGDITGLEVAQYFAAHGLDSGKLDHPEQPEHPEHPETPVGPGEHEPGGNADLVAGFVNQMHNLFDRPVDMPQEPHTVATEVLLIVHTMVELIGQAPDLDGAGA
ncbi:MAG TPA: hypothetical protein VK996_04690 [Ramlibacter sp.]|nr:hypothetical protein [Ramlibacter sp.]